MTTGMRIWSKTAGSNNTADSNVNWAEGQAPSSVNNSARAEMASAAMYRDDNSGTLVTSGTTAAYTVTSNQTFGSVVDGDTIAVRFHAANDASATLNVDGTGAKAIELYQGQGLRGGEFPAGSVARFIATTTSTSWLLHNYHRITGTSTAALGFQITSSSTSAPGYSFAADTDSGVYSVASNDVGIMAGGFKAVDVTTAAVTVAPVLTASAGLTVSSGSVTLPSGSVANAALASPTGLSRISSQTLTSAVSSIDFTTGFSTGVYRAYVFDFDNIKPATDNVSLSIRVSTNAGSTWNSTGYLSVTHTAASDGTDAASASITGVVVGIGVSNTGGNLSGRATLFNPAGGGISWINYHTIHLVSADTVVRSETGGGACITTNPVTGIRLIASSGNIAAGSVTMYGMTSS